MKCYSTQPDIKRTQLRKSIRFYPTKRQTMYALQKKKKRAGTQLKKMGTIEKIIFVFLDHPTFLLDNLFMVHHVNRNPPQYSKQTFHE